MWFIVEGWQVESGELACFSVADRVGFQPEFVWGTGPVIVSGENSPYVECGGYERYRVRLPYNFSASGTPFLNLEVPVPIREAYLQFDTFDGELYEGVVHLAIAEGLAEYANEFFSEWVVTAIIDKTDENRWRPVQSLEARSDRLWLVNCRPFPLQLANLPSIQTTTDQAES